MGAWNRSWCSLKAAPDRALRRSQGDRYVRPQERSLQAWTALEARPGSAAEGPVAAEPAADLPWQAWKPAEAITAWDAAAVKGRRVHWLRRRPRGTPDPYSLADIPRRHLKPHVSELTDAIKASQEASR